MTLPKAIRKSLGVEKGGVVMASEEGGGVVLFPAAAFPIEHYSDERIAEFDEADAALSRRLGEKRG